MFCFFFLSFSLAYHFRVEKYFEHNNNFPVLFFIIARIIDSNVHFFRSLSYIFLISYFMTSGAFRFGERSACIAGCVEAAERKFAGKLQVFFCNDGFFNDFFSIKIITIIFMENEDRADLVLDGWRHPEKLKNQTTRFAFCIDGIHENMDFFTGS